jgi:Flp pilus assembly pilin Flp
METWLVRVSRGIKISHGERGQGMVEYALVVMFVTIVVVGSLTVVGQQLGNIFSNVTLTLGP